MAATERLDGVVGERRAEHGPADTLQRLAVAAVDGRRRVQLHAEGGHRPRRPGRRLGRRRQVRAGERELHARRQRGVEVDVRVVDLDVTPAELVTAIITERGVFRPAELAARR